MPEPTESKRFSNIQESSRAEDFSKWFAWMAVLLPLLPILANPNVSSSDYMMHVARASIIARSGLPLFHDAYHVRFVPLPNLAVDLVVPLLMRFLPLALAGRVFIGLGVVLNSTGAVALSVALHRRLTATALFLPLLVYSAVFSWGFVGFFVTSGLTLWTFAAYAWLKKHPFGTRAALLVPSLIVLYFGHLSAFALLVLSVGGFETIRCLIKPNQRLLALQGLGALVVALAVPAYIHLRLSPIGTSVGTIPNTSWFIRKETVELLDTYRSPSFFAFSLAFWVGFLWLWSTRRICGTRPTLWLSAFLFLCYVLCPYQLYGSTFASTRLLPYVVTVLLAAFVPTPKAGPSLRLASIAVAIIGLQAVLVLAHWISWNRFTDQAMASVRQAPKGTLFVTICDREPLSPPKHFASLWNWWKESGDSSFWHPNFTHIGDQVALEGEYLPIQLYLLPGKQPVDLDPKYRDLLFRTCDGDQIMNEEQYSAASTTQKREMYRRLTFDPINQTRFGAEIGVQLRTVASEYANIRKASGLYPNASTYVIYFHPARRGNPFPGLLRQVSSGDVVDVYEISLRN